MNKILMLKGLPASGKSTYAKELVASQPNKWKRVNRDSLRLMFSEEFNDKNEKFILRIRDAIISQALEDGYNVVIDDLNLSKKHFARINSMFGKIAEIEIDDSFLSIPLDELLKRNAGREDRVPDKVIKELYEQNVGGVDKNIRSRIFKNEADKKNYIPYNNELGDAVIFDIDGTIALMNGRSPFDWTRVGEDLPHEPVVRIAQDYILRDDVKVFFVSGRDGSCRNETENWLSTYELNGYDGLFMRDAGDGRKDSIIKEEIFDAEFRNKYNVLVVFDDRNQTVEKWRELGVPCFQVAPGAF